MVGGEGASLGSLGEEDGLGVWIDWDGWRDLKSLWLGAALIE